MKKYLPWILALPFFCMPINTVYATTDTTTEPDRVTVGVKKYPKHGCKHHKKKSTDLQEKCVAPSSRTFNPIYYVKSIGVDGETVITTDETVWQIASSSAQVARCWPTNTMITISPSGWFSRYDYYLTNTATGESVNAKLSQGPFLQYAIFITQLNQFNRTVTLSNGMGFQMSSDSALASWKVGEAVLLGINTGWFGGPSMIVNINENNYVTATRVF